MTAGRCALTAASFWVFLTLGASDFLCLGNAAFFAIGFRVTSFLLAFFGAVFFTATFFLTALFFVDLALTETFVFEGFRGTTFFARALLAFGRADFAAVTRFFATDFAEERRTTVREPERLKLLVAALISKVLNERAIWTNRSGSCGGRVT